jgi:putative ABC transport system substrate-binding protein
LEVFSYENFSGKKQNLLIENLNEGSFDLFVAIGPEASRFLQMQLPEKRPPILYSMVLNPEQVLEKGENICGVSLSVPIARQLSEISMVAPSIKKIGLIYDPGHNEGFMAEAKKEAAAFDIEVVPLKVTERKNIPAALHSGLDLVDGIWMIPDRTIISESIVQYIIKEALLRKKPTIGYNKFFFESGSLISFVLEYREIGKQAADIAVYFLSGNSCSKQPPRFQTWVNRKVAEKIEIDVFVEQFQGADKRQ